MILYGSIQNSLFFLMVYIVNSDQSCLFYSYLMPFLIYKDNDSGLRPSYYPYILGWALNEYKINKEAHYLF